MPPTVIRFLDMQDNPNGVSFFLARPNHSSNSCFLTADPGQSPFVELQATDLPAGAVGAAGRALYAQLEAHVGIRAHLQEVFANKSNEPPRPIGVHLDSARADSLPWEALCHPAEDFLALDRRWPVVRLLDSTDDGLRQDYEYAAPLRIAAVLSAWGSVPAQQISALDEWKSVEKGVLKSGYGANTQLLVLVCEDNVRQAIAAAGHPNVRVEMITRQGEIGRLVREFCPHILHFFCHGHSGENSFLRIASALDREQDQDGTIYLRPGDLRQDVDPDQSIWLVVLNCCDSANAIRCGDTRNLAASLVRKGFPAVIGMREPVDTDYARVLTEELYSSLVPRLNALPNGQISSLEWAEMLVDGRKRLRNDVAPGTGPNAASSSKHWTIPALYMRTLAFRMRKAQPTISADEREEILANIAELRDQRNVALPMKLPSATKQQMLADFDAQIKREEARLL